MTPGSPGLMGALLIVIGLAFALLAIAIVLNRRDAEAERQVAEAGDRDEAEQPDEPGSEAAGEGEQSEADAQTEPAGELPGEGSDAPQGAPEPMVPKQPAPADSQEAAPVRQAPPRPRPRELLPVAELLREEVTGELILRLGDRYLRSLEEVESDTDRRKLQYASADLAAWFKGADLPARRGKGRRRAAAAPEAASPAEPDRAEGAGPAGREAEAARPVNMIEAINAILEKKLVMAEGTARAVRLVPDPSGGVRVLIGVKSYPLEEVPDEGIKQLIRQAVGEWEANQ